MITTNQKYIVNTHRERKKESKYNTKESYQITGENNNQKKKNKNQHYQNNPKTVKMAIRTYISIITLNVNELKVSTKRQLLCCYLTI